MNDLGFIHTPEFVTDKFIESIFVVEKIDKTDKTFDLNNIAALTPVNTSFVTPTQMGNMKRIADTNRFLLR